MPRNDRGRMALPRVAPHEAPVLEWPQVAPRFQAARPALGAIGEREPAVRGLDRAQALVAVVKNAERYGGEVPHPAAVSHLRDLGDLGLETGIVDHSERGESRHHQVRIDARWGSDRAAER